MPVYTTCFENVAVSATQDLFEVIPGTSMPITLHSLFLHNVGDDAEEMLRITVRQLSGYTSGSGGTSPGVYSVTGQLEGTPYWAVVEANNTSKATATGSNALRAARGWNIRVPFEMVWTPETRPMIAYDEGAEAASLVVVRLENSPADAISMSGELTFEEHGAF